MTTAYVRRSTAKQSLSVERQKEQISIYADANNIRIDDWAIEEPLSGTTPFASRPALSGAIKSLGKGDQLLALNVSRIARDEIVFYSVLGALSKRQIHLVLADGSSGDSKNPLNKLLMGVMALVASAERENISIRTKQGLQVARKRGRALGRPDMVEYGFYYDNGWLKPNPNEQRIIAEIVRLRSAGLSHQKIADSLTIQKEANRLSKPFSKQSVGRILKRHESRL